MCVCVCITEFFPVQTDILYILISLIYVFSIKLCFMQSFSPIWRGLLFVVGPMRKLLSFPVHNQTKRWKHTILKTLFPARLPSTFCCSKQCVYI